MATLVAQVAVATGLLLLLQAATGVRTDSISSQLHPLGVPGRPLLGWGTGGTTPDAMLGCGAIG